MARELDDIFNECYERIRVGESLESCLMRYPKHAAELESLLRTAFDIGRRASYVQPRPEFKHWARTRFEGAQHYARQQRQPAKPRLFSWRQGWAVAVTAVLILLLTGGSTIAASSEALPDEPLYPLKLATEQVRLTFAISDAQKAQVQTQLVETRATEVEAMANAGKTEQAVITAASLAKQLELANSAIVRVESARGTAPLPTITEEQPPSTESQQMPPARPTTDNVTVTKTERFKKSLENSTSKSLTALKNALEKAPPQAKPNVQRAINTIWEKSREKQSSDNQTVDGGKYKPTPAWPEPSQPATQSDNQTINRGTPTPTWPGPGQPTTQSDNITKNKEEPNPFSPKQNQPSSSRWPNTGK